MSAEDTRVFFFLHNRYKNGQHVSSKQLSVCSLSVLRTNSQNSQFIQTRFKHRPLTIRALKKDVYFTSGQELKAWVSWIFEAPGYGTNMWQKYSASLDTNCINPLFIQQSHRFPLIYIFVSILTCNWVKGHSYTNIHQRSINSVSRALCSFYTIYERLQWCHGCKTSKWG